MALVVKDMSENPVCDNHQFQINMKIMTSVHDRCTMPSSAAASWNNHHFAHRIDKENKKSSVPTVDVELELKNTLCWYWFLRGWSCDMFPHCPQACNVQQASGFGKRGAVMLRGATVPLMMWTDLICSVTTERQRWKMVAPWCSVVSPRNRMGCWLAGGTLHHSHYLLRQTLLFTQRSSVSRRKGARTGCNNEQYNILT